MSVKFATTIIGARCKISGSPLSPILKLLNTNQLKSGMDPEYTDVRCLLGFELKFMLKTRSQAERGRRNTMEHILVFESSNRMPRSDGLADPQQCPYLPRHFLLCAA